MKSSKEEIPSDESRKFNRTFRLAIIVFAAVEFLVLVLLVINKARH